MANEKHEVKIELFIATEGEAVLQAKIFTDVPAVAQFISDFVYLFGHSNKGDQIIRITITSSEIP